MATIKERFEHLGLAHNNKILMIVGNHIAEKFRESIPFDNPSWYMTKKLQTENDQEFEVCDYPETFIKRMDFEIINFLEHYLEPKHNG
jgi:hypothetical protein